MYKVMATLILFVFCLAACAQTYPKMTAPSSRMPETDFGPNVSDPAGSAGSSSQPTAATEQYQVTSTSMATHQADTTTFLQLDDENENVVLAITDLAQRLAVSPEEIELVAVIKGQFTSHAFYCRVIKERIRREDAPQMMSGETILLRAGVREFEYHANDQGVVFCHELR